MPSSRGNRKSSAAEPATYCCKAKQYFLHDKNLVKTLEIYPRVIICKKKLKKNSSYDQLITIKNKATFPRSLKYSTDSVQDTQIIMPFGWQHNYLLPDETIVVRILITPQDSININRRRHIYAEAQHPNIIFEIPIIILSRQGGPSMPAAIDFPHTVPRNKAFYEFVAYNPTSEAVPIIVKTTNSNMHIIMPEKYIPKKDYIKILLVIYVKSSQTFDDILRTKVGNSNAFTPIKVMHEPIPFSLFTSLSHLKFEELRYERQTSLKFSVCNDSHDTVNYTISFLTDKKQLEQLDVYTNKIQYEPASASSMLSVPTEESDKTDDVEANNATTEATDLSFFAYKHFSLNATEGELEPNTSKVYTVIFRPVQDPDCDFDDSLNSPFIVRTKLFLIVRDELNTDVKSLILVGMIRGPEIEIKPAVIDLRRVYMGEEQCEHIKVLNVDGIIDAHVKFKDYRRKDVAGVYVTPEEGFLLPSCKSGVFKLSFFACVIGKFMVKLKFKVKNGSVYDVIVRGTSQQVRVKVFPDILEFGSIPFAVPQKRFVLLLNPLSVPVTVKCTVTEDGDDTPLVLNIRDINEYPPITMMNHVKIMLMGDEDVNIDDYPPVEFTTRELSDCSYCSVCDDKTSYSSQFEEDVLDTIPDLAVDVVKNIKEKRFLEKTEAEKRIVTEAMDSLLTNAYFKEIFEFSNYAQLDWNTVPANPQEIYCDGEIIYLKPNSGKTITIILIPNLVGYYNRSLDIRVCPVEIFKSAEAENRNWDARNKYMIPSELMTSKLWLEYHCRIPEIEFPDVIKFDTQVIYGGQEYEFLMQFSNLSTVPGFLYYDVVPKSTEGEMFFTNHTWKYYVAPETNLFISCYIIFKKRGLVKLSGIVKILGHTVGYPFHIYANVLSTKVNVLPNKLYHRQNVMEYSRVYVYIENATPTVTWLTVQLKYTKHQRIEPNGTILGPNGQGTYFTIHSTYYDPEVYKNSIIIGMQYGEPMEIPVSYNITGVPVYFEPNIKEGFDAGVYLINNEDNFYEDIPRFQKTVKVSNRGERSYRLNITRLKSTNNSYCAVNPGRGRINITPKFLILAPKTEGHFEITGNACDALMVYNEFRLQIVDQENKLRTQNIRFVITAKFIAPELVWSRREIHMEYRRTHIFKELMQISLVGLTNTANVEIESVLLRTMGPFRIKELFEHPFKKEIEFKLQGLEKKEITVLLHKPALRDEFCSNVHGRVMCLANDKLQKPLIIKLKIRCPELRISTHEVTLFTQAVHSITFIELENRSCLEAQYKWKKSAESIDYVAQYDDVHGFSLEILSDIFRMLEISEDEEAESEVESIYERNMTLRYQRYRCRLQKLEDTAGVQQIIDELIDNLDYEHRRYGLTLENHAAIELNSSKTFVNKTIDSVLSKLKLEDTYDISAESSEDCNKEKTIYFLEKSGLMAMNTKKQCYIYLPPVKMNYAHTAKFILDVVGSCPQEFKITLVNLEHVIELSNDNVYLGIKPWYEMYKTVVRVKNVTQYSVNIGVDVANYAKKRERISHGYGRVASDKTFTIPPWGRKVIRFEGIMGFCEEFVKNFKMVVNDSGIQHVRLRGQGVIPILTVTSKLSRPEQDPIDVLYEYKLLQRIYYFDMFKSITEQDDEMMVTREENILEDDTDYSQISLHSASSVGATSAELRFFKLMKSYVLVYNNDEVPNGVILEQLLETQKFLEQLKVDDDSVSLLHMVHQDYIKMVRCYDEKMPINLKHFTAQPLPFEMHGYVLNMNEMRVNRFRKFVINMHFFGPGKLIASARTAVKIPGLLVDFEVDKSEDRDFIYYSAEEKAPDFFDKPYRNMFERIIDMECDPKVKHAHSFDTDLFNRHKREVSGKERKQIQNYYNSLNKSVYIEHKHHYILCKIFSNSKKNFSGTNLRVIVLLRPESKFYEEGQMIEDYLYIDLHLGPTLPILLRGLITQR